MAQLDKETIKTLTKLSRIDCSPEEQESLLKDLQGILNYIDQLHEVNTDNVLPCNQVLSEVINVTREDVVGQTLSREKFLGNVPTLGNGASGHVGGMIRVPPVLKQN